MWNRFKLCLITLVGIQNLYSQCFDEEITVADFPYDHTIEMLNQDDDWEGGTGGLHADGHDYAYKLTLTEPTNIYLSTCYPETNVDVEIAVYTIDCDTDSWILYQDDSNSDIYFNDNGAVTQENYDFACLCGYDEVTYANMLPLLEWGEEGEERIYYIVVQDRNTESEVPPSTIRTRIGYSLNIDDITTSDDYSEINYFFSESVYGGTYEEIFNNNFSPLDNNDFNISVDPNGGNNVTPTITSLTNMAGNATSPGDNQIKVNIDINGTPTGVEILTIGPANESSIFNSVGVPLLNPTGTSITLIDILSPSIDSSSPEDNAVNVPRDTDIEVTFSEEVRYEFLVGVPVNITDGNNYEYCIELQDLDTGADLDFTVISDDQISFVIEPDQSFNEYTNIRVSFLEEIIDLSGNALTPDDIQFRTVDQTSPTIASSTIATSNAFAELNFNEPIYGNSNGTGPITLNDLDTLWNPTAQCSSLTLTDITDSNNDDLIGGETTVRVSFNVGGTPTGNEEIIFKPTNGSSIYDEAGNAMSADETTDTLELNASAQMLNAEIADSNIYVDLTFSAPVFGNESTTQPVYVSDFGIEINSNNGEATSVTIDNLTDTSGGSLIWGEETIRIHVSFNTLPSGVETITISPSGEFRIFSEDGVAVPQSESVGPINLEDERAPRAETSIEDNSVNVDENEPLQITFDEDILFPDGSEVTADALNDPTYVQLRKENAEGDLIDIVLNIEEFSPDSIVLSISPTVELGSEETFYFSFNATLQDIEGNPVAFAYAITFTIRDYLEPTLINTVFNDNSYIEITFDDEIYGTPNETGAIDENDFRVEIISDSVGYNCNITSVTDVNSNLLIGGEQSFRINMEYNFTPTGLESIIIGTSDDKAIYDDSGNQIDVTEFLNELLKDELVPTIDTWSLEHTSYVDLRKPTILEFGFSEPIDIQTIDYTVTSKYSETVPVDALFDSEGYTFTITLSPGGQNNINLTSSDSIFIQFNSFEDLNQLHGTVRSFTYLTPILADYNLDTVISYADLDTLRLAFKNDGDEEYELGPATGVAPHFILDPDSKFDIEDGMVFMQMWSWFQANYGEIIDDTELVGRPLNLIYQGNKILFILDESSLSGQFQFSYRPGSSPVVLNHRVSTPDRFFIKSHHAEKGFSSLAFSRSQSVENDTIQLLIPDEDDGLALYYEISDGNNSILQKGVMDINPILIPQTFTLYPAFPNPFNPSTTISFDIPESEPIPSVYLNIYDLRGRLVKSLINGAKMPGKYSIQWDASNSGSGIYFVHLIFGNTVKTQKILLLK